MNDSMNKIKKVRKDKMATLKKNIKNSKFLSHLRQVYSLIA